MIDAGALQPDEIWRPEPLDVAAGWVGGRIAAQVAQTSRERAAELDPIAALEAAVLPALERSPCVVAFSGGRDSSLVLAAAMRAARRYGLAEPVAATNRYPGFPATDESKWQEQVIGHLGVQEWVRFDNTADADLLGAAAQASLERHGLMWPPRVHCERQIPELARGGSLLTGEGGDTWFGEHRSIAFAVIRSKRGRAGRRIWRAALRQLTPSPARRRPIERAATEWAAPWLTAAARDAVTSGIVEAELGAPLRWDRALEALPLLRGSAMGSHNRHAMARRRDYLLVDPITDPVFTDALIRCGGRLGFPGRTALMVQLFSGLLPQDVLRRKDKVFFNDVVWGPSTRDFASEWMGDGLDPMLVDRAALAAVCREGLDVRACLAVHAGWLYRSSPSGRRASTNEEESSP